MRIYTVKNMPDKLIDSFGKDKKDMKLEFGGIIENRNVEEFLEIL